MKNILLIIMVVATVIYSLFAFTLAETNPFKWDSDYRGAMSVMIGICSMIGIVIYFGLNEENEEN